MILPLSKEHRSLTRKPSSSADHVYDVHVQIIDPTLPIGCQRSRILTFVQPLPQPHQEASHSPPLEIHRKNLIVCSNEHYLVVNLIHKFRRK